MRRNPKSRPGGSKNLRKPSFADKSKHTDKSPDPVQKEEIRLNRYIAISGVCSRRDADILISEGKIMVNGDVVKTLGYKVKKEDQVIFKGKRLQPENHVYLLLNKPKDFITTTSDTHGRKTVLDLVKSATAERIFPVGRLDRLTTGLLLLTNDGDLAKKMSHPSSRVKKVYHITLDKPLAKADIDQISKGVKLEDGVAEVDEIFILTPDKREIGIEIHMGKNRIIRRIFEHLGYHVRKLDRVLYGSLTKKDIPRGKWRRLTEKEVIRLKHFK